jgi:hypothetical protein
MYYRLIIYIITLATITASCKKDRLPQDSNSHPPATTQKILLKDIIIPHLPSTYYHFEYGSDSLVRKADFASGYFIYDVLHNDGRIAEMRNNILVNHDTLRYVYDNTDRISGVNFISQNNELKRHVVFQYNGAKLSAITWDHKGANNEFVIDRTLTFTYHPDGNLKR